MTISLMSLLGGSINLSAATGNEDADDVTLSQNGDAAFDTIMAASEIQEISAEKLRQFFVAHGAEVPAALTNGQPKSAGEVLAHILAANDGKKLPGDMIVALQEMLPQDVVDAVEFSLSKIQGADDGDIFAALPERELTPEELSQLVQETGLPPVVIFAALQETPAASPNLAYAMVDDMGAAEADANLPLPTPAANGAHTALPEAASAVAGEKQAQGQQVANQIAAVDFSTMDESKREVLKRIVNVLRGDSSQGEFDWNAAAKSAQAATPAEGVAPVITAEASLVAANSNEKPAQDIAKLLQPANPAAATQAAPAQQPAADGAAEGAPEALLQTQPQAQAKATSQQGADMQMASQGKPDAASPAPATQSADGTVQNFASALEQTTSLRSGNGSETMQAQLRQPHYPQGTPTEQVNVQIAKGLADGSAKMEIHLKPGELGSVDVTIKTDADGRSHVTVTADKRDTLDMLQRDARSLERALADAGLKADSNSLSFNLRGGDGQQQQAQQNQGEGRGHKAVFDINGNYADLDEKLGESEMALTYDAGRAYRLNLDWGVDISV